MTGRIAVEWSSPPRNVPMTLRKENFERQQESNRMTLTQSRCSAKIHSAAMSPLFFATDGHRLTRMAVDAPDGHPCFSV